MHGNVVGLNPVSDDCPEDVVRAPLYLSKRRKLPPMRQLALSRIEKKLFDLLAEGKLAQSAEIIRDCTGGCYRCALGWVSYHLSRSSGKVVLSDFGFDFGGGGGCEHPTDLILTNGDGGIYLERRERLGERIAACALAWERSRVQNRISLLLREMWLVFRNAARERWLLLRRQRAAHLLMRSPRPIKLAGGANTVQAWRVGGLPYWSTLYRVVKSPAQLDNSFAHAILMGEWMCRLEAMIAADASVSFHNAERCFAHSADDRAQLFQESKFVIQSLLTCQQRAYHDVSIFQTPELLHRDRLADDRTLELVKSEIVFYVTRSVARQMHEDRDGEVSSASSATLRKYAMLCRFAVLSNAYFGSQEKAREENAFVEVISDVECPTNAKKIHYFKTMSAFGYSTSSMVEALPPAVRTRNVSPDMQALQRNLIGVVSELLGVDDHNENSLIH